MDLEGTDRLIESCWRNIDLFFYIDGPFKDYNHPPLEEVRAWRVVDKYPNAIYYDTGEYLEHEKRQMYLDLCKQYNIDTLIIADTDEYFHPDSDWNTFTEERKQKCNDRDHLYNLKNYTEISYNGVDKTLIGLDQPRLVHWPSMIHYLNGHHYQLAINGTEDAIVAKDTLYSVKLCHDSHLRTQERKDAHDKYITWLRRYEAEKMMNESPKEKENRLISVWSGN